MKKVALVVCLFVMAGFVSGCSNTLEGAGRDIEKTGEKIQETF